MPRKGRRGKEFELLIARIEKMLAPRGGIVTSPDYIADRITGRKREVDASIRIPRGDGVELTTIECRDYRRCRQDDRWLEQLITKREKIGADRTIAVSSTGFSTSAVLTATHYGIVLREMSQIVEEDILRQLPVTIDVAIIGHEFSMTGFKLVDDANCVVREEELPTELLSDLSENPNTTVFIRSVADSRKLSAADFFEMRPWPLIHSASDEQFPLSVTLEATCRDKNFSIDTVSGERALSVVEIKFDIHRVKTPSIPTSVRAYSEGTRPLMDVLDSTADIGETPISTRIFGSLLNPSARAIVRGENPQSAE